MPVGRISHITYRTSRLDTFLNYIDTVYESSRSSGHVEGTRQNDLITSGFGGRLPICENVL